MSGQFDPYAYVAQSVPAATTAGAPAAFDPYAYVAKGTQSQPVATSPSQPPVLPQSYGNPEGELLTGFVKGTAMPAAGAAAGGLRGLWDLAMGKSGHQASQDIQSTEQAFSPEAATGNEQSGIEAAQSNWNPLNWPGLAIGKVGDFLGKEASEHGASPVVSTALNILPAAAMSVLPMVGALKGGGAAAAEEAGAEGVKAAGASGQATEAQGATKAESAKSAPKQAQEAQTATDATPEERQAILERTGIKSIRQSALSGDAKDASTDFQMSKYDQPAGRAAAAQFEHERNALADHAAGIVESTGGTLGMDEDALANKGAVIDKPFEMARQWFKAQTNKLYAQADERAQGVPINLMNFRNVLKDDSLMTNQDRVALRNGLNSYLKQLNMVQEGPGQFFVKGNVANAETVRKYLGAEWSPGNSRMVSQLKNALDQDVAQAAGNDVYQQARAMHALKSRTLDDPDGISQLFETDPNTPINRSTPFEKIPQKLSNLPAAQFENLLNILKQMPDEIQPAAQDAMGEIRGYLANKLLQAGTQTRAGSLRALWNGDAVSNILKTNAMKYKLAFQDDPEALQKITDLNKAGQILKVDSSYPGADAQAANAMKRGLMSRILSGGTRMGGAAAGSLFGPFGAAAGEAVGGAAGESLGFKTAEKAALKKWQERLVPAGED